MIHTRSHVIKTQRLVHMYMSEYLLYMIVLKLVPVIIGYLSHYCVPVVHEQVRGPDELGVHPDTPHSPVLTRVPVQLVVQPILKGNSSTKGETFMIKLELK